MATSLSLNKRTQIGQSNYSTYNQVHVRTYATLTKQADNVSTVKFEVATWADYSGYAATNTVFKCAGATKNESGTYSWSTSEQVRLTTTVNITHNADGTKTYNGTTSSTTGYVGNASHNWSIVLPTIDVAGKMNVKVNGAWKVGTPWINVNGTWKKAKKVWINVNGTWKKNA